MKTDLDIHEKDSPEFAEVSPDAPETVDAARFRIGEQIPFRGLVLEVTAFQGRAITLTVIDATRGAKRRIEQARQHGELTKGKRLRRHRTGATSRRGKGGVR